MALLMSPVYESEALVSYDSTKQSDQALTALASRLGGLSALTGLNVGDASGGRAEAVAILKSRALGVQFIEQHKLMPILFAEDWDTGAKKWRVAPDEVPTVADAFERFDEDVRDVSEDSANGLIRVVMRGGDREQIASWANALVHDANKVLRERALRVAQQSIVQLQRELANTSMLDIKQVIYRLMETQLSSATLANAREDYAFRVIDPAVVPDADDYVRPNRILIILLSFLLGPALGFVLALLYDAWAQAR